MARMQLYATTGRDNPEAQQNNLLAIPLEEEGWIRGYVLYQEEAKEDFLIASMLKILSGYGETHGVFS